MNKTALAIGAIGLCGISSAQVMNRTTDLSLNGFSIKGGLVVPLDSSLSNFASNFTSIGLEYRTPSSLLRGGETSISVDFFLRDSSGSRGTITPIMLNQKWFGKNTMGGKRTYFVGGAGFAIMDINSSNTVFALKAGFGVELGENIFVETAAYLSERGNDARLNSIGLFIGYRF